MNVYVDNPGHMTKMAVMPIYDTNLFPEMLERFERNFAYCIDYLSTTKLIEIMPL